MVLHNTFDSAVPQPFRQRRSVWSAVTRFQPRLELFAVSSQQNAPDSSPGRLKMRVRGDLAIQETAFATRRILSSISGMT